MALVFSAAGVLGVVAAVIAANSRPYRLLSAVYAPDGGAKDSES